MRDIDGGIVFGGGLAGEALGIIVELDLGAAEVGVLAGDFGGAEAGEGFDEGDELVEVGGVGGLEEFEDLGGDEGEGALDEVGGIGRCRGGGALTPCRVRSWPNGRRMRLRSQGGGAPPPYRRRVVGILAQFDGEGRKLFEALGLGVLLGVIAEAALSPGG